MSRSTLLKLIAPLLFVLAIILGLLGANHNPYSGRNELRSNTLDTEAQNELYSIYQKGLQVAGKNITPAQTSTASFLAVGDIMLSRNVAQKIKDAGDPLLPFSKMSDILKSTDFNFGNLESPFYKVNRHDCFFGSGTGIFGGHSMIFGAPCIYANNLADNNFGVLNLANNHALDQGVDGLNFTISVLDEANIGIQHVGVGKNLNQAWQPAVIDAKGIKICFIGASYASVNDSGKTTNNYVARIEDLDSLKSAVTNLKSSCDFIIATMHAGTEYTRTPNAAQIKFAHAAIDLGADMVIGGHPHWVQTIEKYCPNAQKETLNNNVPSPSGGGPGRGDGTCQNPKYIFYSLGNFIFDQEWSQETKEGLALKITISKNVGTGLDPSLQGPHIPASLKQIELLPVIIENYSTPRPASPEETKKILEKIGINQNILN